MGSKLVRQARAKGRTAHHEVWLAQLDECDDRQAAAAALRARLVEKASEVELLGRREAA